MTRADTEIDVAVIGGGVVGLASAAAIAADGHQVCVLDAAPRFGHGASSHNSGVIHAGIYYPRESLKAALCVEGRDRLYRYCADRGVPHRNTGKLIAGAAAADGAALDALAERAAANGVRVERLSRAAIARLDARLRAPVALWSPDTGILDADAYVRALAADAAARGAAMLPATPVTAAEIAGTRTVIVTPRERIRASVVVNAAGLFADDVSRMIGGETFRMWACRGDYAELRPSAGFAPAFPIYPLPDPTGHGLGVHITPTTWGSVLLGPTARYVEKTDYDTGRPDPRHFADAAALLVEGLSRADVVEGGSGMRAKMHPEHESFADWAIRHDRVRHGSIVQAAGIDSPGLTSSLAIGARVAALAGELLR